MSRSIGPVYPLNRPTVLVEELLCCIFGVYMCEKIKKIFFLGETFLSYIFMRYFMSTPIGIQNCTEVKCYLVDYTSGGQCICKRVCLSNLRSTN